MEIRQNYYKNHQLGPLLDEDALLLQSVIKMTNPRIVVELGHFWGKSAMAMLEAMDADAELHSYDNTKNAVFEDKRFHFYRKSQEEVDIPNIDFVFFDASHELELNRQTFRKLATLMNEKGIIAVHDTGTWIGGNVFNALDGFADEKGNWVHCPDELTFMNWIRDYHPEWQQIHLHSSRQVRHGITLLQKYVKL
jgi:hypothetical protein